MALVSCTECGAQISEKALVCIKCGAPTVDTAPTALQEPIVTTQQTSKKYKAWQAAGAVLMVVGAVSCSQADPREAAWWFVAGLFVFIGARAAAWWNNG